LLRTSTRSVKRRLYPDGARVAAPIRSEFFEGDLDPARKYLTERAAYLNWKTTRQVRYSIRLLFVDEAERHNEHFSEAIVELERKHQEMAANRGITMEQLRNGMGIPSDQLRRNGLQEFLDFMRRSEVRENDHEGKLLYWELEESFLDKLIAWRRDVKKRPGGIKQLEKKYAKVTSPIQSHEE